MRREIITFGLASTLSLVSGAAPNCYPKESATSLVCVQDKQQNTFDLQIICFHKSVNKCVEVGNETQQITEVKETKIAIKKNIVDFFKGYCNFVYQLQHFKKNDENTAENFKCTKDPSCSIFNLDNLSKNIRGEIDDNDVIFFEMIFTKIFNEYNYKNGMIIDLPDFKTIKTKIGAFIEAFLFLFPELEAWIRLLRVFCLWRISEGSQLDCVIKQVFAHDNFRNIAENAIKNPNNVDLKIFYETSLDFVRMVECMRTENQPLDCILDIKKVLIDVFMALKEELSKEKYLYQELFPKLTFFYLFTVGDIYEVDFVRAKQVAEHFKEYLVLLFGQPAIRELLTQLGVILQERETEFKDILMSSEGFISKHFMFSRCVWVHFGENTIRIFKSKFNKEMLPVFCACLRMYVILLGGDGILMTFQNGPTREIMAEDGVQNVIQDVRCGYWNLNDLTTNGNIVFLEGKELTIRRHKIIVNNVIYEFVILFCDNMAIQNFDQEQSSEIVLFYSDKNKKINELNTLFEALPGCLFSRSFRIEDASAVTDSLKKKPVLDFYKATLIFGSKIFDSQIDSLCDPNTSLSDFNKTLSSIINPSFSSPEIERICSLLIDLSMTQKTFRELHIELIGRVLCKPITEMIEKIMLKTLTYKYFMSSSIERTSQIFEAIHKNEYMRNNLKYFYIFPSVSPLSLSKVVENAPLHKLSRVFCKSFLAAPEFRKALKSLKKKNTLQDMVLYLEDREMFSKEAIKIFRDIKLFRFSLMGTSTGIQQSVNYLFAEKKNGVSILSKLGNSVISVSFSYYEPLTYKEFYFFRREDLANANANEQLQPTRPIVFSAFLNEHGESCLKNKDLDLWNEMGTNNSAQKGCAFVERYLSVN